MRWPNRPFKNRAVGIFDEIISRDALVVRSVTFFNFWMRVHYCHDVEMLRAQIGNHFLWIGKPLVVPRERLVIVLGMDIEPDDGRWNFLFAERVGEEAHARFGIVAVAALIVAERPQRRQRHSPG